MENVTPFGPLVVVIVTSVVSDLISMTIGFQCYTPCAAFKLNRTGRGLSILLKNMLCSFFKLNLTTVLHSFQF